MTTNPDARQDSLIAFTRYRMPKYQASRVHRYIARHLEMIEERKIDRLMISVPPRTGKSELAAKSYPAFALGHKPDMEIVVASAGVDLARDVGWSILKIIKSKAYRTVFPGVSLEPDVQAAGRWRTRQGGSLYSIGVGSDVMGRGADLMVIDDCYGTLEDALSETVREKVFRWFTGTLLNRLNPGGAIVMIGHRMHEDDLQGRLIERMKAGGDNWTVVRLPALAEDGDPLGRAVGEPIWPERFSSAKFERDRAAMLARDWSALYQQNPVPEAGEFFAADLLTVRSHTDDVVSWVRGWDLASTAKKTADYTVGVMMGITRSKKTVIGDVKRMRGRPDEVADLIEATARADTRRVRIAIARDPGQAGAAQEAMYVKLLNGFMLDFSAETGSKEIRARPLAVQVNAGAVSMIEGEWNAAFREELRSFPFGRHDDQVDAASRAHMVLTAGKAPMRISDSVLRSLGIPAPAPSPSGGESFWYNCEGGEGCETGEERLKSLQRTARTLKVIDLDDGSDEPLKGPILSSTRGG